MPKVIEGPYGPAKSTRLVPLSGNNDLTIIKPNDLR